MDAVRNDLKNYGTGGLAMLAWLSVVSCALVILSLFKVAFAGGSPLLAWALLALVVALASSRQVIKFPGTHSGVSMAEAVTFLAVIALGPYHAILLTLLDVLLASHRLKLRPTLYLFNASNHVISVYVAARVYYVSKSFLSAAFQPSEASERILLFALTLTLMAATHYALHIALLGAMSYLTYGTRLRETLAGSLPWEPLTFLAGATVAGVLHTAYVHYGVATMLVALVVVSPVPIIIYYAFKTYRDNLTERESHYQEMTGIYDAILEMLAMAIDAKDDVTHDHIQRVKHFARRMGEIARLSDLEIEALKAGALLHDIGKIGVPAYILNKPGKLTEHEFEQMKMHTIIGADMLSNVDFRYPVVPIVRHHHERWDGRGYPDGLRGDAIPVTARILTLVDTYDALRSDRPYHKAMSREQALDYLRQNAGTVYDPRLVSTFLSVVDTLEEEAAKLIAEQNERRARKLQPALPPTLTSAKPAAGLAKEAPIDRAAAALNSITETNQRMSALYEMSRTLSSLLSLEETVVILTSRLAKLIPFSTCVVSLFDSKRSEYEMVHAAGMYADQFLKRRHAAETGITGWVITNQKPMYNTNPVLDLGFLGAEVAASYTGVMVFPLAKNNEPLGAVAVYSTEVESYSSEYIQLMESIAQPASDAVYNALTLEEAQKAAVTDSITGLANTRGLSVCFERERARAAHTGEPLSLLMVTINNLDELKSNSSSGNNQLVFALGQLIKGQMRDTDLLARYWDNAFIALLPNGGRKEVAELRARIQKALDTTTTWKVAASVGAALMPKDGDSFEELLQAAQMDCVASRASLDLFTSKLSNLISTENLR